MNKIHFGIDVICLNKSVDFYANGLGMTLVLINHQHKTAVLTKYSTEINLFESPGFQGYKSQALGRLHVGIHVDSKFDVDKTYKICLQNKARIIKAPYIRFDGDYTFFMKDPNNFNIEVFYGAHSSIHNDLVAS